MIITHMSERLILRKYLHYTYSNLLKFKSTLESHSFYKLLFRSTATASSTYWINKTNDFFVFNLVVLHLHSIFSKKIKYWD